MSAAATMPARRVTMCMENPACWRIPSSQHILVCGESAKSSFDRSIDVPLVVWERKENVAGWVLPYYGLSVYACCHRDCGFSARCGAGRHLGNGARRDHCDDRAR